MAFLSIIVPIYNKEAYLDDCLISILEQTFTNFELILVNDGSTDSSGDKCDYYKELDNRIVVIHQCNKGVSEARNTGLKISKGNFIGFVDSDDTLEKDMYEILLKNVLKFNADVSICGVRKISNGKVEYYYGNNSISLYNSTEAISSLLKKEFMQSVYDKVYKSEIAKKIKFTGNINEDIFYNFLFFKESNKIIFNDIIKYNYIIRDNSVSMSKFNLKYMESLYFSKKILTICSETMPNIVNEAKVFDFMINISLLNLILLSKRENYSEEYVLVVKNLNAYSELLKEKLISTKHRYAFNLFKFSPILYKYLMKVYCNFTNADLLKRI